MAHAMTVSQIKGEQRWRPSLPSPGTHARAVYDRLRGGEPITGKDVGLDNGVFSSAVRCLRDYYGCEIEGKRNIGSVLTGEWHGATFVPIHRLLDVSLADPTQGED